jgi:hypothetical protein
MRKRSCYPGFVEDHTKRRLLWIAAIIGAVAFIALFGRWFHGHWADADFPDKILNFAAIWLPFVLSIIVAFIPSSETRRKAHMRWRACLIGAGLVTSIVMWRQQDRAIDAARHDQEVARREQERAISKAIDTAVAQSVERSNKHSDEHSEKQTEAVKKELKAEFEHSTQTLTGEFVKDASSIAKNAKPEPPQIPKLAFTFFWEGLQEKEVPITTVHARPIDGVVTVTFTIGNVSKVPANNLQLWVRLCSVCSYAKEPDGFEKLKGSTDQERIRNVPGLLLPDVFLPFMSVAVKVPDGSQFVIGFRYACEACGAVEFSPFMVIIDR